MHQHSLLPAAGRTGCVLSPSPLEPLGATAALRYFAAGVPLPFPARSCCPFLLFDLQARLFVRPRTLSGVPCLDALQRVFTLHPGFCCDIELW